MIGFKFSDNRNVEGVLEAALEHVFSASPRERARQLGVEQMVGVISRDDVDLLRTCDEGQLHQKMEKYRALFESGGARIEELGCFDVVISYDPAKPDELDTAVQALVYPILEWAHFTRTTVAFGVHVVESNGRGALEPIHMHVLWDRRRGQKVYKDNVLQWYLYGKFADNETPLARRSA